MIDLFWVCLKNIGRKKNRSLLTIISIAIGVGSVVLISAVGGTGQTMLESELSKLGLDGVTIVTDGKIADRRLDEDDLKIIQASDQVNTVAPIIVETSRIRMHGLVAETVAWGIGDNADNTMALSLLHGRVFTADDLSRHGRVCLVDERTAQMFYKRSNIVGKQLTLEFSGVRMPFEVVGVVDNGSSMLEDLVGDYVPGFAYLPYTVLQQAAGKEGFSQIAVQIKYPEQTQEIADTLVAALDRNNGSSGVYKAENLSQQKRRMGNALQSVTVVLAVIAGISLVVAGLGIMIVMISSVQERTREIGIKKSIGASSGTIMLEFLIEAFVLSASGGVVGAVIGWVLILVGGMITGMAITYSLGITLFCLAFTTVVGVLFGIYPAKLAAKMRPVDALRVES